MKASVLCVLRSLCLALCVPSTVKFTVNSFHASKHIHLILLILTKHLMPKLNYTYSTSMLRSRGRHFPSNVSGGVPECSACLGSSSPQCVVVISRKPRTHIFISGSSSGVKRNLCTFILCTKLRSGEMSVTTFIWTGYL